MSDEIKLPGWGHLDFDLDWRSPHGCFWSSILVLVLLTAAAYQAVRYVVTFRWLRRR